MKIDRQSWHCRLYLWWYENKYGYPKGGNFNNLCPYMRAVIFWAPMRAVYGTWIKVKNVPIDVLTIPLTLWLVPTICGYVSYGLKSTIWTLYGIILLFSLVMCALFGAVWLLSKDGKDIAKPLRIAVKASGFYALLVAYLRSAHDRVCPEISWNDQEP